MAVGGKRETQVFLSQQSQSLMGSVERGKIGRGREEHGARGARPVQK